MCKNNTKKNNIYVFQLMITPFVPTFFVFFQKRGIDVLKRKESFIPYSIIIGSPYFQRNVTHPADSANTIFRLDYVIWHFL